MDIFEDSRGVTPFGWSVLVGIFAGLILGLVNLVFAQTAILTPQGNMICLPGSIVTTCAGTDGGLSILPLGPQTFAITPMAPIQTYQEPEQRMESSTPFILGPSQSRSGSRLDSRRPLFEESDELLPRPR